MNEEARKKALEIGKETIEKYSDAMKELAEIERQERETPVYRFFAIDYFATGEGRSIWLMICHNNPPYKSIADTIIDHEYEKFANFVGDDHYLRGFDELTEREFLDKYTRFIPYLIAHMLQKNTIGTWQTHLHFNLS
jgi:hypothetical protein